MAISQGTHVHDYSCWEDFVAAAEDAADRPQWDRWFVCAQNVSEDEDTWRGTQDWATAVAYARYGWREGREQIVAGLIAAARSAPLSYRSEQYDVGGAYPCIPIALAGDPACMVELGDQAISARPVIRLRVDLAAPSRITGEQIVNHGIAVLSAADALQSAGYSVEISLACATNDPAATVPPLLQLSAVFKRAGDALDLDRAAFALANPAVSRRLYFALLESHADISYLGALNHGRPCVSSREEGIVVLPPADETCIDITAASQRIYAALAGAGVSVSWIEGRK